MFTKDLCFRLLERFTGIRPIANSVGNPHVHVGKYYYVAACPVNGHQPTTTGPEVHIEMGMGGTSQSVGHADHEISMANLVLRAMNDIHTRLDRERKQAHHAMQTCITLMGD